MNDLGGPNVITRVPVRRRQEGQMREPKKELWVMEEEVRVRPLVESHEPKKEEAGKHITDYPLKVSEGK